MAALVLATVGDLDDRGIDTSDTSAVQAFLASASAAVTSAAGSAIGRATSTVRLTATRERRLTLPAGPVRSVESVLVDDAEITDWHLRGDSLWLARPWSCGAVPSEVEVTYDHGLEEIPADVVDLVCALVGAALTSAAGGYEARSGLAYESIDDYRVGYQQGEDAQSTLMELPSRTVGMLRRRFGRSTGSVVSRS